MPSPKSLGFITVSIPGTSVPLVSASQLVRGIRVQPRASATSLNVGNVYIVTHGGSKNTPTSIYAVIGPEQTEVPFRYPGDATMLDLFDWAIDADNASDGALIGYS
jgi:hypothetical protein